MPALANGPPGPFPGHPPSDHPRPENFLITALPTCSECAMFVEPAVWIGNLGRKRKSKGTVGAEHYVCSVPAVSQ